MTRPWRYRECPACGAEFAAGDLGYSGTYRPGWGSGPEAKRACPRCGYTAPTSAFAVTRDRHTGYVRDTEEWRAEYARVLASPAWRKLRKEVVEVQRWRCAGCDSFSGVTKPSLELHHLHYRTLGHEAAADVVGLCHVCHQEADDRRARGDVTRAPASLTPAPTPSGTDVPIPAAAPEAETGQIGWLDPQPGLDGERDDGLDAAA